MCIYKDAPIPVKRGYCWLLFFFTLPINSLIFVLKKENSKSFPITAEYVRYYKANGPIHCSHLILFYFLSGDWKFSGVLFLVISYIVH